MGYLVAFFIILFIIIMCIKAVVHFVLDSIKETIQLTKKMRKQKQKSKPVKDLSEYDKINFMIEDLKSLSEKITDKKNKKEIEKAIKNLTQIYHISKEIDTKIVNHIIIDINDNVYQDITEITKKYNVLIKYSDPKDQKTIESFNNINQNLIEIFPIFEQKLNDIKNHVQNDINIKSDMLKTYIG